LPVVNAVTRLDQARGIQSPSAGASQDDAAELIVFSTNMAGGKTQSYKELKIKVYACRREKTALKV